jgi:hypothetical protein
MKSNLDVIFPKQSKKRQINHEVVKKTKVVLK